MTDVLIAAAVAATQPSPEALKPGRELAEAGMLAHLLPIMASAQAAKPCGAK